MSDLNQTPRDQEAEPSFSAAENAAKYADLMDASQVEAAAVSPEALAAENSRLATEVQTLLASFPPGPQRDAIV